METNTKLETYLKDTRFPYISDVNVNMGSGYEDIFKKIEFLINFKYSIRPEFRLVYSLFRQTELITSNNPIIIYDRYLGETFHIMTKTLLLPHDEIKAFAFSCKLIAETLRKSGQFEKALPYACLAHENMNKIYSNDTNKLFYISSKYFEEESSIKLSDRVEQKNIFECHLNTTHDISLISEVFIVFHEISHYLMKNNKLDDYIKSYTDECEKCVELWGGFFQTLITNTNVPRSCHKVFNSESFKNNIIEEMLCDRLAIEHTVTLFESIFDHDYIALAILFCSLHLRWFKHIDLIANYPNETTQYYDTMIRSYFIREILGKANLNSNLVCASSVISDQYQYVFYSRENSLRDLANNKSVVEKCKSVYGKYIDSDLITASIIIDSLIGWNTYNGKIDL